MSDTAMTELYRHFDAEGRLLYVGIARATVARLAQHLNRSRWFGQIATITIERFPSRAAALEAEAKAITEQKPLYNVAGVGALWDEEYDPAVERAKIESLFEHRTRKPSEPSDE